jgi:hypothetical protein
MESDADRLASIKALGGQLVSHSQGACWAIFDRTFVESVDGSIESRQPVLTVRTSDVESLAKDVVFTVGGQDFRVKRQEPDGTGMTLIHLKR